MTHSSETPTGNENQTPDPNPLNPEAGTTGAGQSDSSSDPWVEAMQEAAVAATGAPSVNLAQNPATGHTYVKRPAAARGTTDVPPAARRHGAQYYPNLPTETSWGKTQPSPSSARQADEDKVQLLDNAFNDDQPVWDKVEQLFSVAVHSNDYALLNTAARISSDIDLSAALSYGAAVCAWQAHADDIVSDSAQMALLSRPALQPLITSHATSLMVRRDVHTVSLRLPVSDATMQVLSAWPDRSENLPDFTRLSNMLLLVSIAISVAAQDEQATQRATEQLQHNVEHSGDTQALTWAQQLQRKEH